MLKIVRIARLEISALFFSPVAWLVLGVFLIQNGIGFFGILFGLREVISMGNEVSNITGAVFPGMNGLFDNVLKNVYLYMPLLTMGLMSREISSGTIKLLLSSPVKISQVILGKYLAVVVYGLCLMMILLGYVVIGVTVIDHADIGLIVSGLLGVFMLICTYGAIGLFMSSLTSYPVVAAISTLAIFAGLRFVGGIGQEISFLRDLTYFLSISGRADEMVKGLITSKDLLYFILIIVFFLWISVYRLQSERLSRPVIRQAAGYLTAVVTVLLAGYLSSRPGWMWYRDMTATQSLTLSPVSQEIAGQINGELKMTTYVNLLDANVYSGLPANRNADLAQFDTYRRFIPGLQMDYVYYYDKTDLENNGNMIYQGDISKLTLLQLAEKVADNMNQDMKLFLTPAEIRKKIDLQSEDNHFVRILTYKGKSSRIRMYNDLVRLPGETEISAALKQLLVNPPLIAFASGAGERSIDRKGDRNYTLMANSLHTRHSLVNQGVKVTTLDLNNDRLPDSLTSLVLGDPSQLGDTAIHALMKYIDHGGNLLVNIEPGRYETLNPLLQHLGVSVVPGPLQRAGSDYSADRLIGYVPAMAGSIDRGLRRMAGSNAGVLLRSASALKAENSSLFRIDTLLMTLADTGKDTSKTWFPVMLALQRKINGREQKIVISGDADFMSNDAWGSQEHANSYFTTTLFSWYCNNMFPVEIVRPAPEDNDLLAGQRQLQMLKTSYLYGLAAILLVAGTGLLTIRRRR